MLKEISIIEIDQQHSKDLNLPNQPFSLFGRLLPSYQNREWHYEVQKFDASKIEKMCFPDENYDFETLSKNSIILGAYRNQQCIGLAILQHTWNEYLYLYDLKVDAAYRSKQVGSLLIKKAKEISKENHYLGLFTQGQDNNLGACLFYLKNGFKIGGIDTLVYTGTKQEGKIDILFYSDN